MKVGLSWLREYVDVDVDVRTLAGKLDMSGTKVEAIREPAGAISRVIAAEVLAVEPHPNADNLILVDVRSNDGDRRVVCGAKNFTVGDRVPYAQVGARLPGMEITERKIRGQVSHGMLCSAAELGISRDHSGILVLPPDIEVGSDIVDALHLDDTVLELELTPNRPDCMGMIGVAREVAALLGNDLRVPEATPSPAELRSPVRVDIEDPEGCPRYVARYARVAVAPSPLWMAARLMTAGVRPISNVVDVTNYVLMETGHPLHAFDAQRVEKAHIVVRRARSGERLVTLDGAERELHPDDLVIADPRRPLALAGVMGGGDSEVSDVTTTVILESAYFDPTAIARTSRRHLLRTEASARFEKGADPEIPPYAAARALALLADLSDAHVASDVVDAYPVPVARRTITLRPQRTDHILGYHVSADRQVGLLRSIGLRVRDEEEEIEVEVPGFRPDLQAEIDLVEEVARLAGFDKLASTLPPGRAGALDAGQRAERHLKRAFASLGMHEAWTSSFTSVPALESLGLDENHAARTTLVSIHNPMSEDENVMRTTLLPGLLRAAAHNVARGNADGALFEIARVYERRYDASPDDPLPAERRALGGVAWGRHRAKSWRRPDAEWDFFAAKGTLEAALGALGLPLLSFSAASGMPFHPTRAASVSLEGRQIGVLGEIHPEVSDRLDLRAGTVAWEVAVAPLLARLPGRAQAAEPSRFPPVFFDLAVTVDERVAAGNVRSLISDAGAPQVVSVRLFDVYRGDQVAPGKKSLAFALEMRQPDRTLSEAETTEVRERILNVLAERVGASLRT